jgi:hypothetical protein
LVAGPDGREIGHLIYKEKGWPQYSA